MSLVLPDTGLIIWMMIIPVLLISAGIIIGIYIGRRKRDQ